MNSPLFVVVGHVNRGKSSIVSTLAADASVAIDAMPGTTRDCHHYRMRIGDAVLLEFVDTPGFERPRQMLAWLRDHETSTAERGQVVWAFFDLHQESDTFHQECALIKPILEGGLILYVVDASRPPSVKEEAEMEILRWTGRPRMALLNPIGSTDYAEEWRSVLDQYFNLVRSFDAQRADFGERMKLLSALREVNETSREPIERAMHALRDDRRANLEEAAGVLAEMLAEALTLTKQKRIAMDIDPLPYHASLSDRYYDRIRALESQAQQRLKEIFGHRGLQVQQEKIEELDDDLFNLSLWNHLGLSSAQLIALPGPRPAQLRVVRLIWRSGEQRWVRRLLPVRLRVQPRVGGPVVACQGSRYEGFRWGGKCCKSDRCRIANFPGYFSIAVYFYWISWRTIRMRAVRA